MLELQFFLKKGSWYGEQLFGKWKSDGFKWKLIKVFHNNNL